MKIKANLLNKPVNFQMDDCQIEKVVELPRDQFSALVITPLTNQPFIAENKRWMFADDSAVHCLLVLGQGSGDGVLIYSAGYDYPRLAAYLPGMRDKDNILFVVSRGLLNGTSETTFSPNTGMTRGMFVTALGRLAGVDPADYQSGKFTDVKADAYYAPYVNWAAKTGIVSGTTDTTFAPDTNINREQMAVIMKNYAVKLGYTVPKALEAVTFADNASISSWAKEAVESMQQAGILAGKTNNRFDPAGTATRAEVATVLWRFVEIIIDPQTANG